MSQDISGGLENNRCSEIIRVLSMGDRSGRLFLSNGGDTANIFFRSGEIIHAQCGLLQGVKAIYEAAVWMNGEYRFYDDDSPDVVTVDLSVEDILNEAHNRIRQMDRITSLISSSAAVYQLDPDIKEKEILVKAIQWKILSHIDGKRSIADISQKIGLGASDTMKVFYTLIKSGLLKEAEASVNMTAADTACLPGTPFIDAVKEGLIRAIGPVAPFVIMETAKEMGYDLLSDDPGQKAELVETLSNRIPSEPLSLKFLDAMTDLITSEGA